MIQTISDIVEDACMNDTNRFGYGIWKHHITYVVRYAKERATQMGADVEIVEIAALLHDYASIKDYSMYEEHHIHGGSEAESLLNRISEMGCITDTAIASAERQRIPIEFIG